MYVRETHPTTQNLTLTSLLITLTVFVAGATNPRYTNTDRKLPSVRARALDETVYKHHLVRNKCASTNQRAICKKEAKLIIFFINVIIFSPLPHLMFFWNMI